MACRPVKALGSGTDIAVCGLAGLAMEGSKTEKEN
jgi:hypothetical protein